MYIPKKLVKYGIKILKLCDVQLNYMLNVKPYIGKVSTHKNDLLGSTSNETDWTLLRVPTGTLQWIIHSPVFTHK